MNLNDKENKKLALTVQEYLKKNPDKLKSQASRLFNTIVLTIWSVFGVGTLLYIFYYFRQVDKRLFTGLCKSADSLLNVVDSIAYKGPDGKNKKNEFYKFIENIKNLTGDVAEELNNNFKEGSEARKKLLEIVHDPISFFKRFGREMNDLEKIDTIKIFLRESGVNDFVIENITDASKGAFSVAQDVVANKFPNLTKKVKKAKDMVGNTLNKTRDFFSFDLVKNEKAHNPQEHHEPSIDDVN